MKWTGLTVIFCVAVISTAAHGAARESIAQRNTGMAALYTAVVARTYPHDPEAFTQGLVYLNGTFFEGTGLYGKSTLRRIDPSTGKVEQRISLERRYFGEGITVFNDKVIQLTWKKRTGFVYDKTSFSLLRTFWYPTEGWGLTHDETHLIMSDGTDTLFFMDPATYTIVRTLNVSERGRKIHHLNELEYVNGEIFANVWLQDRIARIDPDTGQVTGWIFLGGLLSGHKRDKNVQVFNGIAYDEVRDRLFVTVKNWPLLYEITLIEEEFHRAQQDKVRQEYK